MGIVTHILTAWLIADFLSGFWHWIEDRYFDESWPIIGKYIAKPNTLHHAQPSAFLANDYWTRNWTTILPAAVACLLFPSWWLVFLFVSQANEIHAWAHQRCSSWVRALQETGILQSPRHHGEHHRSPFDVKYCVMSDWLNPILDYFQVWRWMEYFISPIIKVKEERA